MLNLNKFKFTYFCRKIIYISVNKFHKFLASKLFFSNLFETAFYLNEIVHNLKKVKNKIKAIMIFLILKDQRYSSNKH